MYSFIYPLTYTLPEPGRFIDHCKAGHGVLAGSVKQGVGYATYPEDKGHKQVIIIQALTPAGRTSQMGTQYTH